MAGWQQLLLWLRAEASTGERSCRQAQQTRKAWLSVMCANDKTTDRMAVSADLWYAATLPRGVVAGFSESELKTMQQASS
jgi:hypothetical protein